jgi:hypothetical protein
VSIILSQGFAMQITSQGCFDGFLTRDALTLFCGRERAGARVLTFIGLLSWTSAKDI